MPLIKPAAIVINGNPQTENRSSREKTKAVKQKTISAHLPLKNPPRKKPNQTEPQTTPPSLNKNRTSKNRSGKSIRETLCQLVLPSCRAYAGRSYVNSSNSLIDLSA